MDSCFCGPCGQLSKSAAGIQCMECDELLCDQCTNYHKALKATKEHTLMLIIKYKSLIETLKKVNVICTEHPERGFDYICTTHDYPCCLMCTQDKHSKCTVISITDDTFDMLGKFEDYKAGITIQKEILQQLSSVSDTNLQSLCGNQKDIMKDLKRSREKIDKALDTFEFNIKRKLEISFNKEKACITSQREGLLKKLEELKICESEIGDIKDVKLQSNVHLVLLHNEIKESLKQISEDIEKIQSTFANISSKCEIKSEINLEAKSIKIDSVIDFQKTTFECNVGKRRNTINETGSSTVEEEALHEALPNKKVPDKVPSNKAFLHKLNFTLPQAVVKLDSTCCFVKVISSNSILVGRFPTKIIIISDKIGNRLGHFRTDYPATSAVAVNHNIVAVTANRAVVFFHSKRFEFIDIITMGDNCYGITIVKDKLIVNCESKGLVIMDMYGNVEKIFGNCTGKLNMCGINKDSVALVEVSSCLCTIINIVTGFVSSLLIPDIVSPIKGIAGDRNGNLFITSYSRSAVFIFNTYSETCDAILSKDESIDRPSGIDINTTNNELYVLNNGGTSISVFESNKRK